MRLSTRRAMTTVRRKTAPRTISRCHQGIVNPVLVERQGFPAGEALLEAVPEGDLVLAEVPAEQHLLVAAKSRKVDQAAIEVLYEHAEPLEALHAFGDRLALTLELLLERPRLLRVEVAAVAGDPLDELRAPRRGRGHRVTVGDESLRDRAHLFEMGVGLVGSEVARAHPTITARRARRSPGPGAADGSPRATAASRLESRTRDFPLVARRDLGGGAVCAVRVRAEPAPARRSLGRSLADARPRLGHGRLGALGQRLVPADRGARL